MYIIESYPLAVALLILTMLCWGSWPATQKLTPSTWRFELFYWDYVIGILLGSLIFAFTMGSVGDEGRGFIQDLNQASNDAMISAFIGGVIFNLANILFVAAIAYTGMSVAFPIGGGLALVLGVVLNYFADPGSSNPVYLFAGATGITIAIILSAMAGRIKNAEEGGISGKGIILALLAGAGFAYFFRFVAEAMVSNPINPEYGLMTSYTAVVIFALGVLASNILFNTILMKRPFTGEAVSYGDYFKGATKDHMLGHLGGIIWATGLTLALVCSEEAGFGISWGLSQGNAMIAAIWGVFIWKEFKGAPAKVNKLIVLMFVAYLAGIILIILSKS